MPPSTNNALSIDSGNLLPYKLYVYKMPLYKLYLLYHNAKYLT